MVSLPTGLLEDAVLGARGDIIAWLSRNGNPTGFVGMLELPVTPFGGCQIPTVIFEQDEYFRDFHGVP
jgi:hypothetical protein